MSKPAVLIRKSTGDILKHAPYPNEDMSPVLGLDPDLEWLLKHTPYPSPDYDPRIYELEVTEEVTEESHPEHPELKMFKKTYATNKRPVEDIYRAIENAEESANRGVMNYRTNEKLHMLAVGILTRKNEGIEPTDKEVEILNKIKEFDVKIWKNDEEKQRKKNQVDNDLEPDIDSGWESE